jgi:phosphoglycerol transferase MdoB-like AlkP superfamily enzyme
LSSFVSTPIQGLALCAVTAAALTLKQLYAGYAVESMWPSYALSEWLLRNPSMIAAVAGSSLALTSWTLMLPSRSRRWVLAVTNLLVSALTLTDSLHLRWQGDLLSAADVVLQPEMLSAAYASAFVWLHPAHALYFIDVAIVGTIARIGGRPGGAGSTRVASPVTVAAVILLGVLLTLPALMASRIGERDNHALQREAWAVLGVVTYRLVDMFSGDDGRAPAVEEIPVLEARLASRQAAVAMPSSLHGVARGANVILLSAESLQAFTLGLSVAGQPVTPHLSAFAAESVAFTQFYDQTHLGTTSDGEFMTLNSLFPAAAGYAVYRFQSNGFEALPSVLRHHGYRTVSAVGAGRDFWNAGHMHHKYGIQISYFRDSYVDDRPDDRWIADEAFFQQTAPRLAALPRPFFAFLLSSSNHHPFGGAPSSLKLGALTGTAVGDYLQSVHRFDAAFGNFIDDLRRQGMLEDTVVALYGDHQAFVARELELGALLGYTNDDVVGRFMAAKRVPLLIRLPGGRDARVSGTPAGHLDVAPTLFSLLGVQPPSTMLGRDASAGGEGVVAFRDGGFIDATHLFVNGFTPSTIACYQLATRTPVACDTLSAKRREARESLRMSDRILTGNLVQQLAQSTYTRD